MTDTPSEQEVPAKWHDGYKTYSGIFLVVFPFIVQIFGYDVADVFNVEFARFSQEFFVFIGAGLAIYGRWHAKIPKWVVKKDK